MSTSIDIQTNDIEVIPSDSVVVETDQNNVCVQPYTDVEVIGSTKEYTIIGDAIFASQNIGEAPQWLSSIIDSVIGTALDSSLTDLAQAQRDLISALEELGIANNNYTEMVNIDARVDSAVSTRLAALNANIENANATIAELQITKASATEASAIALDIVSSSLSDTAAGTIGGTVSQLNSSITTLAGNVSSARTLVESRYGELNEAIADLDISVNTSIDGVKSAFTYDSTLKVGDKYYKTGFGLKASATSGGAGTEANPYTSEFWIDATRFKFTNSSATGGVSPFTIDAEGSIPKISFNGTVSFSNVTGDDVPEAGATRNIFRGRWLSGTAYNKGDIVTLAGDSWVTDTAHTSTVGNKPGVGTTWRLLAAKGNSVTTVNIYRRSATELGDNHKPTGTSTYNFEDNTVTGLNNSWTSSIPEGTDALYVSVASVAAEGTSSTGTIEGSQWSTPVKYVENGLNTATVFVFKRTASNTVPAKPGGTSVYSFNTQSLTTSPTNGWSEDLPSTGGPYRWMSKATAASTSDTDNIAATEWSTPRLIAEDGIQGAQGSSGAAGQDAKAVKLIASNTVLKYSTAGKDPTPTSIVFTAEPVNTSGTLMYRFYVNDVATGPSTTDTYTYTAPDTMSGTPTSVEVELYEDSVLVARDEVTLISLRDGASTLAATLSNEAHVVPTLSDGNGPILGGSGTTLRVFEGIVPLTFKAISNDYPLDSSRGTYNIQRTYVGLTPPDLQGVNTTTLTQPDYTSMSADVGSVVFNIRVRRLDGTTEMLTKVQSLSKSKQGVQGVKGAQGNTGASGQNAKAVKLVGSKTVLKYSSAGDSPTPEDITFTATPVNTSGTLTYRFYKDDVVIGTAASATNTYTYTAPSTMSATPTSIEVELYENAVLVARDEVTVVSLRDGSGAVAATLSNEAHVVPSSASGGSPVLGGSGTTLRVFEGTTPLTFAGTSSSHPAAGAKGTYNVQRVLTGLTAPDLVGTGTTTLTQADYTDMTADVATAVFNIRIRRLDGTTEMLTKVQTLSKSKQGGEGTSGASYIIVYKKNVSKPAKPTGNSSVPSGWSLEVGADWTGNVWKSEGRIAAGSTEITWSEPVMDFASWRKPGKVTIDGEFIEAGSIDASRIGAGVIYNAGADESDYTMKIDLDNGSIYIK